LWLLFHRAATLRIFLLNRKWLHCSGLLKPDTN
jgi:hypothetical protein